MNNFLKAGVWPLLVGLVMLFSGIESAGGAGGGVVHQTVPVEHVRLVSTKTFDEVAAELERTIPGVDPAVRRALAAGNQQRAIELEKGQKLFIFLKRNPGDFLRVSGQPGQVRQYEIGNPATATRMMEHQVQAALYAPLRVVLYANASGGATLEYDRPSTLFGQFGDESTTAIGHELDAELDEALTHAAE